VHRSGLVTHGVPVAEGGLGGAALEGGQEGGRMRVLFSIATQADGRKIAMQVTDRHGRPVDDAVRRPLRPAACRSVGFPYATSVLVTKY
jgi:hypothetical protein